MKSTILVIAAFWATSTAAVTAQQLTAMTTGQIVSINAVTGTTTTTPIGTPSLFEPMQAAMLSNGLILALGSVAPGTVELITLIPGNGTITSTSYFNPVNPYQFNATNTRGLVVADQGSNSALVSITFDANNDGRPESIQNYSFDYGSNVLNIVPISTTSVASAYVNFYDDACAYDPTSTKLIVPGYLTAPQWSPYYAFIAHVNVAGGAVAAVHGLSIPPTSAYWVSVQPINTAYDPVTGFLFSLVRYVAPIGEVFALYAETTSGTGSGMILLGLGAAANYQRTGAVVYGGDYCFVARSFLTNQWELSRTSVFTLQTTTLGLTGLNASYVTLVR